MDMMKEVMKMEDPIHIIVKQSVFPVLFKFCHSCLYLFIDL